RNQALEHVYARRKVVQLGYFYARRGIDRRKEIRRIRKRDLRILAVLCNGVGNGLLRQASNRVGTGKNQISQCAHENPPYANRMFLPSRTFHSNYTPFWKKLQGRIARKCSGKQREKEGCTGSAH